MGGISHLGGISPPCPYMASVNGWHRVLEVTFLLWNLTILCLKDGVNKAKAGVPTITAVKAKYLRRRPWRRPALGILRKRGWLVPTTAINIYYKIPKHSREVEMSFVTGAGADWGIFTKLRGDHGNTSSKFSWYRYSTIVSLKILCSNFLSVIHAIQICIHPHISGLSNTFCIFQL